ALLTFLDLLPSVDRKNLQILEQCARTVAYDRSERFRRHAFIDDRRYIAANRRVSRWLVIFRAASRKTASRLELEQTRRICQFQPLHVARMQRADPADRFATAKNTRTLAWMQCRVFGTFEAKLVQRARQGD